MSISACVAVNFDVFSTPNFAVDEAGEAYLIMCINISKPTDIHGHPRTNRHTYISTQLDRPSRVGQSSWTTVLLVGPEDLRVGRSSWTTVLLVGPEDLSNR